MSDTLTIRPAEPKDYPDILRLNEANVSVLAPMDEQIIRSFAEWAELLWAVEADGAFAAFLIALREGVADYWRIISGSLRIIRASSMWTAS